MVETQTKNQNVFWLWNDTFNFEERGDVHYWLPEYQEIESKLGSNNSRPLVDLAEIITKGETPRTKGDVYIETGIPFIRVVNISEGGIKIDDLVKISKSTHDRLKRSKIKPNDIVFSMAGTIGVTAVVPEEISEANINQAVTKIRLKTGISPIYIATFLNSKYGRMQSLRFAGGGVQKNIDFHEIKKIRIFLPSLESQQKIEQIVKEGFQLKKEAEADYQKSQQLLNEVSGLSGIEKKRELAFWRWSDEIDIIARVDPNYYQKYFQEVKLRRKKLKTIKLENLCSLVDYGTVPTSPDAPSELGTPYLTGKNIQPNKLVLDKLDYLYTATTKNIKHKVIKAGDVVVTQMGTVGNATVVGKEQEGWFFGSFLIRLRPKKDVSPEWLALVINSDFGKQQIEQAMTTATVRTNTNLPTIKGLEILLIDKKKEKEIVSLYIRSRAKKVLSKQKLQEAKDFVENLIKKSKK